MEDRRGEVGVPILDLLELLPDSLEVVAEKGRLLRLGETAENCVESGRKTLKVLHIFLRGFSM